MDLFKKSSIKISNIMDWHCKLTYTKRKNDKKMVNRISRKRLKKLLTNKNIDDII